MRRREVIQAGLAAVTAAAGLAATQAADNEGAQTSAGAGPFQLKYAPHFGMFENSAGKDLVDQLKFAHDQGFRAWEDNGFKGRSVAEQEKIGKALADLGIQMGVFVCCFARGTAFVVGDKEAEEQVLKEIRDSVDAAQRCGATWMTLVPGNYDTRLEWDYQTARCIDLLRRCCEVLEPHKLVMVLEALNWRTNHPGVFLHKTAQAYAICRAVDSPACKVLFDAYHMQIEEGNLIPNLDLAWSEIAYVQCGDNPGRNEPGTGEINYKNVFRHLHGKGYRGVVGMEHGVAGPGKEGEQALLAAYRAADAF